MVFCSPIFSFEEVQSSDQLINPLKSSSEEMVWFEDFDLAQSHGFSEQKPLFVLFTGSDWCKNCQILEESILSRASFLEGVRDRFVFVKVDFPLKKKLSQDIVLKNQQLKQEFHINGFPTVVICLPSGEKLFFAGRFPLEPKECADLFIKELNKASEIEYSLKNIKNMEASFTFQQLEELYKKAQLFGKEQEANLILDIAISRQGDNSFFLQEKYRHLVESGSINDEETIIIKEKLFLNDQDNSKGHKLYVAVCDFQKLSKCQKEVQDPSVPLKDYLKEFGATDTENNWRVELMLAHYHSAKKEKEKALQYLKLALRDAPQFLKADIEKDLAQLESQ
jgi:protein disulfide-isomerase